MGELLLGIVIGVVVGVIAIYLLGRHVHKLRQKQAAVLVRKAQQEVFNRALAEMQSEDPAWRDKLQ